MNEIERPRSVPRQDDGTLAMAELASFRRGNAYLVLLTVTIALCVWVLRRPDQFLRPYAWAEESQIMRTWLDSDWLAASLTPVQGYFVLVTSVPVASLAAVDFAHYPDLAYVVATAVFLVTVLMILLPSSTVNLRIRSLMVLGMVLVPAAPEPFGVLLYSFWWAQLWPLITLLWRRDLTPIRLFVLGLAGLSGPAAAAGLAVYLVALLLTRKRVYGYGSLCLALTTAIQGLALLSTPRLESLAGSPRAVLEQALINLSSYSFWALPEVQPSFLKAAGAAAVVLLATLLLHLGGSLRDTEFQFLLLTVISTLCFAVLSAIPAPMIAGPNSGLARYYFLPFVGVSWILLLIAQGGFKCDWIRLVPIYLLAMASLGIGATWAWHHDQVDWRDQIVACASNGTPIPILTDGTLVNAWQLDMGRPRCILES